MQPLGWIKLILVSIIFIITGLTLPCPTGAVIYSDVEAHWAGEAVCQASVLGLISGYPDGSFKPEQELTQMEALVLFMRAAGYDLDNNKKNKSSAVGMVVSTPQVSWGQEYLNQAVRDSIIEEHWLDGFNADNPITRAQAADLLSRLLHLPEAEISSNNYFLDLNKAAAELRPAIIAVAQCGIIEGYEDGCFYPNNGLKRGQAASILRRLVDGRWLGEINERQVEGWVQKLDFESKPPELVLQSLQGSKRYKLSPDVKCFHNGQECPYQQVINWRVKLYLDSKKQIGCITMLEKRSQGKDAKITGTVRAVALGTDSYLTLVDLNGCEQVLPLSWGAELDSGKKSSSKGFASLKPETFIDAYLDAGIVNKVVILDTKSVSGTVSSLEGIRLNLESKESSKKPQWFNYWDRARIVDKNGRRLENVERGDKLKITYLDPDPEGIDDEIPLEIIITNRPQWKKISGEIERIGNSSSGRQLVLKKNKEYAVDDKAKIMNEDGSICNFSSLEPGDRVEAMVDGAGIIMELTIKQP